MAYQSSILFVVCAFNSHGFIRLGPWRLFNTYLSHVLLHKETGHNVMLLATVSLGLVLAITDVIDLAPEMNARLQLGIDLCVWQQSFLV